MGSSTCSSLGDPGRRVREGATLGAPTVTRGPRARLREWRDSERRPGFFFSAAQSPPRNASRARAETEHAITRQLGAERSGTDGSRLGSPCRRRRPFHAPACGQLSGLVAFSMPRAARWRRREREPSGTAAQREPSPTRRPAPSLTRAFSY